MSFAVPLRSIKGQKKRRAAKKLPITNQINQNILKDASNDAASTVEIPVSIAARRHNGDKSEDVKALPLFIAASSDNAI